jgi:hypothetical protein
MFTPAPASLTKRIAIHLPVPHPCPFQQLDWDKNWDDESVGEARTTLPPAAPPSSVSSNKVKLNNVLDNNTVASATSSQALLLPPTDTTTLPDGSLSTLIATMNMQLEELTCYCNDITVKYNEMHAVAAEARELTNKRAIERKVQLAVTVRTNAFQETVALVASSLNKRVERTT